jgi:hypothetical protein
MNSFFSGEVGNVIFVLVSIDLILVITNILLQSNIEFPPGLRNNLKPRYKGTVELELLQNVNCHVILILLHESCFK